MNVLGIETSCDDTAAAVITDATMFDRIDVPSVITAAAVSSHEVSIPKTFIITNFSG
jgi:tRNA A37 threonylcarbamoyltransferase TsaD